MSPISLPSEPSSMQCLRASSRPASRGMPPPWPAITPSRSQLLPCRCPAGLRVDLQVPSSKELVFKLAERASLPRVDGWICGLKFCT
jgi:hypothetical protein